MTIIPRSPSIRREWIEIFHGYIVRNDLESPSIRREWIEIVIVLMSSGKLAMSPSIRREWIEM